MSELETIVAALNGLGEGAMTAFIVWIAIIHGVKLIVAGFTSAVFITLFVLTAQTIRWCVTKCLENTSD